MNGKITTWIAAPLNNVIDCIPVFCEPLNDRQTHWDEDEAEVRDGGAEGAGGGEAFSPPQNKFSEIKNENIIKQGKEKKKKPKETKKQTY